MVKCCLVFIVVLLFVLLVHSNADTVVAESTLTKSTKPPTSTPLSTPRTDIIPNITTKTNYNVEGKLEKQGSTKVATTALVSFTVNKIRYWRDERIVTQG